MLDNVLHNIVTVAVVAQRHCVWDDCVEQTGTLCLAGTLHRPLNHTTAMLVCAYLQRPSHNRVHNKLPMQVAGVHDELLHNMISVRIRDQVVYLVTELSCNQVNLRHNAMAAIKRRSEAVAHTNMVVYLFFRVCAHHELLNCPRAVLVLGSGGHVQASLHGTG